MTWLRNTLHHTRTSDTNITFCEWSWMTNLSFERKKWRVVKEHFEDAVRRCFVFFYRAMRIMDSITNNNNVARRMECCPRYHEEREITTQRNRCKSRNLEQKYINIYFSKDTNIDRVECNECIMTLKS